MPAAVKYFPPTDKGRDDLKAAVSSERQTRQSKYREALKYYLSDQDEQIEVEDPADLNPNTFINLVKMAADRTATFLFPQMPRFKLDPKAIEDTEEEKWVKDFLDAAGGLQILIKWALRGFLSGHTFLRVKPGMPFPKLILLDPVAVTVFWKADDVSDVFWYENRYFVGNVLYIQDFVRQDNNTWKIFTYAGKKPDNQIPYATQYPTNQGAHSNLSMDSFIEFGNDWKLVDTAEHGSAELTLPVIPPIIDCPHLPHPDDYYGLGEFDQKRLQDDINRLASEINIIVTENSDPRDVVIGDDADEIQTTNEQGVMVIPNPAAKIQRLEMKSDLSAINEMLQKRIETFLAIARVVLLKGEAKDLQRVTNASVRTLFLDALAKNNVLQAAYGAALTKIVKLAIQLSDLASKHLDNPMQIMFGSPLPIDLTEVANINAIMTNIGARSKQTAATQMGDNYAFEKQAMDAEFEESLNRIKKQQEALPQPETQPNPKSQTTDNVGA